MTKKLQFVAVRIENFEGKGENAGYQHFLLFPPCFKKAFFTGSSKVQIVLNGLRLLYYLIIKCEIPDLLFIKSINFTDQKFDVAKKMDFVYETVENIGYLLGARWIAMDYHIKSFRFKSHFEMGSGVEVPILQSKHLLKIPSSHHRE